MCCGEENLQGGPRWSLTKQVGAEPDPLAMPQACQIWSNLGLEATLLPLLEMHWERSSCRELPDTAQQVAKKWFPAQVCCPNTQVSKGSRNAWSCRTFHRGTAKSHSRIPSAPLGTNIVSITAAFLKRGVRPKGKNVREVQVRQRRAGCSCKPARIKSGGSQCLFKSHMAFAALAKRSGKLRLLSWEQSGAEWDSPTREPWQAPDSHVGVEKLSQIQLLTDYSYSILFTVGRYSFWGCVYGPCWLSEWI